MVVEVANNLNMSMHSGNEPVVINVDTPGKIPNQILYSALDAQKEFNQINQDMFVRYEQTKPKERNSLPKGIKIILGITSPILVFVTCKKFGKFLIGLFKSNS